MINPAPKYETRSIILSRHKFPHGFRIGRPQAMALNNLPKNVVVEGSPDRQPVQIDYLCTARKLKAAGPRCVIHLDQERRRCRDPGDQRSAEPAGTGAFGSSGPACGMTCCR
jgi:hypothetical protein